MGMKTKRLSRYCLLLFMSLLVVCCREDDLIPSDLPVEQESAKDNLPWPLYQNMDTENYRPGDNFYMYCNGHYWETADMEGKRIVGLYDTEMVAALNEKKASVTNPIYEQVKAHDGIQVTNAQFSAFLKPFFEKIDGIQSYEDAFRVAGELMMAGARSIVGFYLSSKKKLHL